MQYKYPAEDHNYPEVAPEVAPEMTQSTFHTYQPNQQSAGQQYQYPNGYAPPQTGSQPPSHKPNPWSLSPLAFGLLVAAITAVVVGGAVGGGVGGALSGKDSSS